jgi:hypothetical protein
LLFPVAEFVKNQALLFKVDPCSYGRAFQTFTILMAAAHEMYPNKSYPVALYSNAVTKIG